MKIADGYMLYSMEGTNYLLPVGQTIALRKKGLRLNNTGALLWNAIKSGLEEKDLLTYLASHYQAGEAELPTLQADIGTFLRQLTDRQLISREEKPSACSFYMNIGDLTIGYYGPPHLLHPSLLDFECSPGPVGQHWIILPQPPVPYPLGEVIIRTEEIEIIKNTEDYIITLLTMSPSVQIKLSLDGVYARFYCTPPYDKNHIDVFFQAFRHAFLPYAQKHGLFVFHSSSVLYQDKAWLFSAPSGTGKSTQADYWNKLYHTRILNGDLNMVRLQAPVPIVTGLPWCGTSHIYNNETYPLGGIVLLKKHKENIAVQLTKTEQELSAVQRLISPAWTEEMLTNNLKFSHELVKHIPVFRFLCKKEPLAAHTLRQYIHQL